MAARAEGSEREEKRARILRAALEVCQRVGVEAARMEEVAALARVSKGTLYHFFESKRDLFLATIIDSYEESLRILDTHAPHDPDPLVLLEHTLHGLTEVLVAVAPRMNVYYQAWGVVAADAEFQDRLHGFMREFHSQRSAEIESLVRDGQKAGRFRQSADPRAFSDGVTALLGGFLYRATFDPASAAPDRLRTCLDALVRGLLGEEGEPARRGPQ